MDTKRYAYHDPRNVKQLPVFAFEKDGCTTACIVRTPLGSSPNGILHWATVLLLSKIFPALINFMSLAAFGAIFLSGKRVNFHLFRNIYKKIYRRIR